jgi:hypothetical protein
VRRTMEIMKHVYSSGSMLREPGFLSDKRRDTENGCHRHCLTEFVNESVTDMPSVRISEDKLLCETWMLAA